jgi:hypothetical protein
MIKPIRVCYEKQEERPTVRVLVHYEATEDPSPVSDKKVKPKK